MKTRKDLLDSVEGKRLYDLLSQNFDAQLSQDTKLKTFMDSRVTYLGSQHHIEKLVWLILSKIEGAE